MTCYKCVAMYLASLEFSNPQVVHGCSTEPESDIVQACRSVCAA